LRVYMEARRGICSSRIESSIEDVQVRCEAGGGLWCPY
jgi:hypothetical protein